MLKAVGATEPYLTGVDHRHRVVVDIGDLEVAVAGVVGDPVRAGEAAEGGDDGGFVGSGCGGVAEGAGHTGSAVTAGRPEQPTRTAGTTHARSPVDTTITTVIFRW